MSRKRWRIDTVWCCTWWQDQNCDELECSKNQAILLLFYKVQSVWAYYLRYHLRVQLVLFTLFFAVRLSRLVLTLCNLEQYEVDTISSDMVKKKQIMFPISFITDVWYSQDAARYCWVFVKRNFACESKFSWWLSQLVVVSHFA